MKDTEEFIKIIGEKQDKSTGDWIYTIEMNEDIYERLEETLRKEGKTVSEYFEEQITLAVEHPDKFKRLIQKEQEQKLKQ